MIALADTSAWIATRRAPSLRAQFDDGLLERTVLICDMVRLELLKTARSGREFDQRRAELDAVEDVPIGLAEWRRTLNTYRELAQLSGGHQRCVQHSDLLIAAAAESSGVEVLHYDSDFDRIAAITRQPTRWIAPRGSL